MTSLLPSRRGDQVRWGIAVLLLVLITIVPPVAHAAEDSGVIESSKFEIFLATSALVLGLWATSYNLMLGYAGMVSFAHAAYFGVGAYTVALLFKRSHLPVLEGLVLAPFVAALFGLVTGWVALRAVRLYFSLLTLAISQLLFAIAYQAYDLTGGDNGVHGIVIPDALADYGAMYYAVAAVTGVCLLAMFVLVRSPFGAALAAVRENRERARSVGINVKRYELATYTIAAGFAGVAGGLFVLYQQEAYPEMLYWTANAQPVVITLLGGLGSFLGPLVGAFVYTVLDNAITSNASVKNYFDVTLGAVVLVIVLLAPGGFASVPEVAGRLYRRWRPDAAPVPVEELESAGDAVSRIDPARAARAQAIEVEAAPSGTVLLQVTGLSKRFGGLRAVEDVNLTVRQGDRHAIIGPNGAGKSTLFNLITGRLSPTSGRVEFDGRDITGRPPHTISRAGIGRAFQITSIFPKLSVRENLQYAMLAHRGRTVAPIGIASRIYREEAMELLAAVGLDRYADLKAGTLSHGDQRAIELAISLALGSRMILLDEPTAGMSAYETQKAMELVRLVATERNLTLLFCEHDMEVVFETARTVTVMHQGRVLVEGTPDEIKRNPEVRKVYLGELETEEVSA